MLENYVKQFLAIDGVTPDEAMQHALTKERNRLLRAARKDDPPASDLWVQAAHAMEPLILAAREKLMRE